jgi:hypothetical protein
MPKTKEEHKVRKAINNYIIDTKNNNINYIINIGRLS